ncbi:hypothetical protein J1614_010354 [Plenodomus biglobosus]|nr:hypothetical protein J1614_010354 [Plenodomus biglobosus]
MAPQAPAPRGRRGATNRHHRESRNANTGAGVQRHGPRAPRGHRGGRGRHAVTPGSRLIDRMTGHDPSLYNHRAGLRLIDRMTGHDPSLYNHNAGLRLIDRMTGHDPSLYNHNAGLRLVDRMTGGQYGSGNGLASAAPQPRRLIDRMTGGQYGTGNGFASAASQPRRLVDRMTGGQYGAGNGPTGAAPQPLRLVDRMTGADGRPVAGAGGEQHFSRGHGRAGRTRPGRGRGQGAQGREDQAQSDANARSAASPGPVGSQVFGNSNSAAAADDNDDMDDDHDDGDHDEDWGLVVDPSNALPPQPSLSPLATTPALDSSLPNPSTILATSPPPIRMFDQPISPQPDYQFVNPAPVVPPRPENTYRGNDPIKRMVQNPKLRAILAGKPMPKERRPSKSERMVLRM